MGAALLHQACARVLLTAAPMLLCTCLLIIILPVPLHVPAPLHVTVFLHVPAPLHMPALLHMPAPLHVTAPWYDIEMSMASHKYIFICIASVKHVDTGVIFGF